jgi:hypothetical protein
MKHLAKFKKSILIFLLICFMSLLVLSLIEMCFNKSNGVKFLNISALVLSLAGLVQLEITGLFEKVFNFYADEEKFPYGPPSHFTRELFEIKDPDRPIQTWLWSTTFQERNAGFLMLVVSVIIQIIGTWLT